MNTHVLPKTVVASIRLRVVLCSSLLSLGVAGLGAQVSTDPLINLIGTVSPGPEPARILVKPKPGADLSSMHLLLGTTLERTFPAIGGLQVVRVPAGASPDEFAARYRQAGFAEYAEPDVKVRLLAEPNDARYTDGTLWGLHNTGQAGGTPGADIRAPEGWNIRTTAENIVVAVIDTGLRLTHEDLAANLWTNPGEAAGNGRDDDGDGWVDDLHGINTLTGGGDPTDDHGHGSHVAGVIGGVGDNAVGITGVAWRVRLMALKFIDAQGRGLLSDAVTCIDYARRHGARIINASWGAPGFDSAALRDAIASARDAGILFVAAAGNAAADNDSTPLHPASYPLANIIAAAATNRQDGLSFFSDFGATSVDLGAPGEEILSCWIGGDSDYRFLSGTSMSAAYVSGVAAVLMAQAPGEDYAAIRRRILEGADPRPALAGRCVTGGRLNLLAALGGEPPPPPPARATVTVRATDAAAAEAGRDAGVFTFTREGDNSAALIVDFQLGGIATKWNDYRREQGDMPVSVTIPAGAGSATLAILPVDDSENEGDETVVLSLADSGAYVVGSPDRATVTIADNDAAPPPPPPPTARPTVTVTASQPTAMEGGGAGVFTVRLSGPTSANLIVRYTLGGNGQNGVDYQRLEESVTVPAGATTAEVRVVPIDDADVEIDEPVYLMLFGWTGAPYIVGQPDGAAVTIQDNDRVAVRPTVTATASDATASESGDAGTFTIRLSEPVSSPLTVRYTLGGHAQNGVDYQNLTGAVTVPAGAMSAEVRVVPLDDRDVEIDEPVYLMLSGWEGAPYIVGRPDGAAMTIRDND